MENSVKMVIFIMSYLPLYIFYFSFAPPELAQRVGEGREGAWVRAPKFET